MDIVNLTPHDIVIVDNFTHDVIKTYPSKGNARISVLYMEKENINGVPIVDEVLGSVYGLPEKEEEHYYIVSNIVKAQLPDREDLLAPVDFVRDMQGKIIGCKGFRR